MTDGNRPVLLVGSLNLQDRDAVFDAVSSHLKDDVRAVPDGETGERLLWAAGEAARIARRPELAVINEMTVESPVTGEVMNMPPLIGPAEGVDLAEVRFGPYAYLKEAVASYEVFKARRDAGDFHPGTRFQVSIPTPMMFALPFVKHRAEALVAFERDLAEEVAAIAGAIPPEDLALQWDIAGETAGLEMSQSQADKSHGDGDGPDGYEMFMAAFFPSPLTQSEVRESIVRVTAGLPEQALLGVHLCYGNPEGEHVIQPKDLEVSVELANGVSDLLDRRLDWVHMAVPINRDDDGYFAPLERLKLKTETQLYLGLLHKEDGITGAKRRIEAASKYVKEFGVASECGLSREPRDRIEDLLELHHNAAYL